MAYNHQGASATSARATVNAPGRDSDGGNGDSRDGDGNELRKEIPNAPAGPEEPPADPTEPMNPA
jgi:hypothetical protein